MTVRERTILFKINEAIQKMTASPSTTYSPQTGEVYKAPDLQQPLYPLPTSIPGQTPGSNPTGR